MPCRVVLGGQWGDEGKGKIVDYLAADADAVVRFQGGANAGHTLVAAGRKYALHLIPSGVLHPECELILGNGMVIDAQGLADEIEILERGGLQVRQRLRVSSSAHLVLPIHKLQDEIEETRRGEHGLGTTRRGIGPAYADKAARTGVRLEVLSGPAGTARDTLRRAIDEKRAQLAGLAPQVIVDVNAMVEDVMRYADSLGPLICDTPRHLHALLAGAKHVLLEGAQGALLDIDHGSYPFVTSSSCTSAGALAGSGLAPQDLDGVTGIVKAYATRVGSGSFPTELCDATGERLREVGNEYGTTTGRPRRCGWFDAAAVRYAARISGITEFAVTKLDVLDAFAEVRIATAYEDEPTGSRSAPTATTRGVDCRPQYRVLRGWQRDTSACRRLSDLPAEAREFVAMLEREVGVPIRIVSVGPGREHTFTI